MKYVYGFLLLAAVLAMAWAAEVEQPAAEQLETAEQYYRGYGYGGYGHHHHHRPYYGGYGGGYYGGYRRPYHGGYYGGGYGYYG